MLIFFRGKEKGKLSNAGLFIGVCTFRSCFKRWPKGWREILSVRISVKEFAKFEVK